MTDKERKFPIMFGDGRTREVDSDFIVEFWPAHWDSVVSLRHQLTEYLADEKAGPRAKELCDELDVIFEENKLEIPIEYIAKVGEEFGWPEWYKKFTGLQGFSQVEVLVPKKL